MVISPDFSYEQRAIRQGLKVICGIDEAGRGPWAGPVVAAAVILDETHIPSGLNDSKKLNEAKREALFPLIMEAAQVGVGVASAAEIDDINILQATYLAMSRAVEGLGLRVDLALVDGNRAPPELGCRAETIIGGDAHSYSIAAASIFAKVARDRYMQVLSVSFPDYGWQTNQGYGSPEHLEALGLLGPTPHHRRSFAPVTRLL